MGLFLGLGLPELREGFLDLSRKVPRRPVLCTFEH
jgi:hypothetical protein